MDYIVQILRTLFFNIDRVVYEGIGNAYDLLLRLSRVTVIDDTVISNIYGKIYALIGIFMLFKISFSLITYILNPDEFVDKDKGFASIIKRVIISLVMLVLVPYGFREATALQIMLLEDNTLASLIFNDVNNNYQIDTAGDKMKFILMYTFFQPNYNGLYEEAGNSELASCAITYEYTDAGKVVEEDGIFVLNSDCFGTLDASTKEYSSDSPYGTLWDTNKDLYQTYVQGVARQNFNLMFKHDIAQLEKKGSKGVYLVDYMYPLSTAVGVAVLWILLMFCIDVAVRSVKLAFYQLIAPVPILSYIDPKTKDGMFNKWLKQCGTTYASLFMRLLALYLAIFLISEVTSSGIKDVVSGERITHWWSYIFVIIGVLMFAKQLPKILEDTLGFKGTGDFTLNPLKKLEDGMLGGKTIKKVGGTAAAVGVAGGLAFGSNLVGGFATGKGLGRLKGITSGIAGGFSAMGRATVGGMKGEKFGKNWASSYGAAMQAKQSRADRKADGVGWTEMTTSKVQQKMGIHTAGEKAKSVSDGLKSIQTDYSEYEKVATGVDVYAKYASKQAAAAQSRGDFVAQQAWEKARDTRIAEIAASGGKVVRKADRDVVDDDFFGRDRMTGNIDLTAAYAKTRGGAAYSTATTVDTSNALNGLAEHMKNLAAAMNKAGANITGFGSAMEGKSGGAVTEQTVTTKINLKDLKTEALNAQQGIDYNNQHLQDVDKYGAKKGQK